MPQQGTTTADDPLPTMIDALRSQSLTDRLQAAKDLGRLGWLARDAMPALVNALNDAEGKVREAAAHAIGGMGPEALPTLVVILGHPDKRVRRHAVWALGKLGPLAVPAIGDLCQSLKDIDPRTASGAAQALGNMGTDGADSVPALAEAMRGTNIVLCRLASKALSQIGAPALPTLIEHLQHADPFIRGESALAIGWMGGTARAAVPYLTRILRGPDVIPTHPPPAQHTPTAPLPVRNSATLTPIQITAPTEVTAEFNCRVFAAQALGRIGPAAVDALDELCTVVSTAPEPLRDAAQRAIRQIEG